MKNLYTIFLLTFVTFVFTSANAQVIKNIPGDYSTIEAAVSDLNTSGVPSGGVTFNVAAGHTETIAWIISLTATGTASDPIIFQKSGAGANPIITAYSGGLRSPSSPEQDGLWRLIGSDHVTIDGIDLFDPNTVYPETMEYGYALYKENAANGCQNVTIKNCTVTLSRLNNDPGPYPSFEGSRGIMAINATYYDAANNLTITSPAGGHSNNKFYSNTIQNCNYGIIMIGSNDPPPYTNVDINNDIGGASLATGNIIRNFGGGGPNISIGILTYYQHEVNISFNNVNNLDGGGVQHQGALRGITTYTAPGANTTVNNNIIFVQSSPGESITVYGIENAAGAGASVNINNNTVSANHNSLANNGAVYGIFSPVATTALNVNGNTISLSARFYQGGVQSISCYGMASGPANVNNNNISGITCNYYNQNVSVMGIYLNGYGAAVDMNVNGNNMQGISQTGTGYFAFVEVVGLSTSKTITNNTITNVTISTTGPVNLFSIAPNAENFVTIRKNSVVNQFTNLSISSSWWFYALRVRYSTLHSQIVNIDSNNFSNISVRMQGLSPCAGIYCEANCDTQYIANNTISNFTNNSSSPLNVLTSYSGNNSFVYSNTISNISNSSSVTGMLLADSATENVSAYGNFIGTLTSTSSTVTGIGSVSPFAGANINIYKNKVSNLLGIVVTGMNVPAVNNAVIRNNLVGDLRSPSGNNSEAITGIRVTGGTSYIYYNTVYLNASSSATTFGTSALCVANVTANVTSRNNIFVNTSTPGSFGGYATAFRYASTPGGSYNILSNNNLLYAGTTAVNKVLYGEGLTSTAVNGQQTLSGYKSYIGGGKDSLAISELPSFLSTTGSSPDFLHINSLTGSLIESGAANISGTTDDYDGNVRQGNPGYSGAGSAPDIGGDEFEGSVADHTPPVIIYTNLSDTLSGSINRIFSNVIISDSNNINITPGLKPRLYYKRSSDSNTFISNVSGTVGWKYVEANGTTSPFDFTILYSKLSGGSIASGTVIQYFVIAQDNAPTPNVSVNSGVFATSPSSVNITSAAFPVTGIINSYMVYSVSVSGALIGNGHYGTLTSSFSAVNGGAQTGSAINIQIYVNTTEPVSGATLNSGAWTSLIISPAGGIPITVSSAVNPGSALINLNGADNVTIDGLNTGGNHLMLSNTTVSSSAGTCTIRFNNDASNNVITNCVVLGSSAGNSSAETGTICFGQTAPITGNDNNLISYCDIGNAGASLPSKGICSIGSTATLARYNSGDTIRNCNIYNFFNNASESMGVFASSGSTDFMIADNKFFQASPISLSTSSVHSAINIASPGGSNFTVKGNTIGYASPAGIGVYSFSGASSSRFYPINLLASTSVASSVQGNTIAGISISGTTGGTLSNSPFTAIYCFGGLFNIGNITGNTIGSQTSAGSISYISSGSTSTIYAIANFGATGNFNSSNNNIGGITLGGSGGYNFFGIRSVTSGTWTCQNNIIGGTIPNSIISNTSATSTAVIGIENAGGVSNISGNIIRNLTSAGGTTGSGYSAPLSGIYINSNATGHTISQNEIYSLTNTNTTLVTPSAGIYFNLITTSGSNVISKNSIHSHRLNSPAGIMSGIMANFGTASYTNNIIRLGVSDSGTNISTGCAINGILENAGINNFYHNSIYIGGNPTSAASITFAFQSSVINTTRNYLNNIFYNARSNSGSTGKHYSIKVGGTTFNPFGLTCNYNILYVTGVGGVLGLFNAIDRSNIALWRSATGADINSNSSNPLFVNPTGTSLNLNLHIGNVLQTPIEAAGSVTGTVTDDIDGETRSALTPVDIGADAGKFAQVDINPMNISYANLTNDTVNSSRNLSNVLITDADGVQGASGLRPRVYFKKKSDANVFNDNTSSTAGWKYAEANGAVSPFDFTMNYSLLNGPVVALDTIQYFVVAQDLALSPHVTSKTASFTSYPLGVDLSTAAFPVSGAISSFIFNKSPLNGDYTVGLSLFNQITGRNIYFDKIVNRVVKEVPEIETPGTEDHLNKDPEIFTTSSHDYVKSVLKEVEEEVFIPMENGKVYEGPLAVKRVYHPGLRTDAMSGVYATITAAMNDIKLWGLNGPVRFLLNDAAYNSESLPITVTQLSGSSAINTLTIKPNTGVVTSITGPSGSSLFTINGGDNFIIDGSNLNGGTSKDLTINNTSFGGCFNFFNDASGNTVKNSILTSAGTIISFSTTAFTSGNDNNIIRNNDISGGTYGIFNSGTGTTQAHKNSGNQVTGNRIINFSIRGIMDNANSIGTIYTGNEIFQTSVQTNDAIAVHIGASSIEGFTFTKNYIHDLKCTSTRSMYGMFITGLAPASVSEISNNIISLNANSAFYVNAIYEGPVSNYNIFYNTILIYGTASGNNFSVCYARFSSSNVSLKNNILVNKVLVAGGSQSFIIRNTGSLASFSSDHNDLKNDSSLNNIFAYDGTTYRYNLDEWKTGTAKDSNSISADPLFVGAPNLHIDSTAASPVSGNGIPVAGITTDFDNDSRSLTAPDIGADEFNLPNPSGTLNLTMIIEGFYDQAADSMRAGDSVTVYLRNSSSPYTAVDSAKSIINSGSFTGSFMMANASSGNYYIQVKHRNSIDTWSAGAVTYTQGGTLNYNFTSAQTQAFGSNMKQVDASPLRFGIYNGDVNRDGSVNLSDLISVFNDAGNFVTGYVNTDVTGENVTNLSDIILTYNNSAAFVVKKTP